MVLIVTKYWHRLVKPRTVFERMPPLIANPIHFLFTWIGMPLKFLGCAEAPVT